MVKDLCFEVIETCLNRCMFCSSNSNCNKSQIISFEDFKRVIDYFMSNGGIEELSLSGGEPFLHPNILDMISYSKSLGIRTVVFTSGLKYNNPLTEREIDYIVTEKKAALETLRQSETDEEILKTKTKLITKHFDNFLKRSLVSSIDKEYFKKLYELGLDKIVFDYQAHDYKVDSYIMGRNEIYRQAFLNTLFNASISGLNVDVHFIPMKPNYKEINDILDNLNYLEIPNISILNFVPQGRGRMNKEKLLLSNEELLEFFDILNFSKSIYSGNIRIGIPLQGESDHKCTAGLQKLDIKFDGTILPCPAFKELTIEECVKYKIILPNIYDSLETVKIKGYGTRIKPLCKQI